LNIRKPPRYVGRVGQAIQIEDATETSVPLALTTQRGVDIAFTSVDLALNVDDFSDRFVRPAIASVANGIDNDGLANAKFSVNNEIGVPGTVPNALLTYLQAGQKLDEMAAPRDNDRSLVINPGMQATIVDALKGLFQDADSVAQQYLRGTMGKTIGFKWSMDQNCPVHTVGAYAPGGATVTNAQTGALILTGGWPNSLTVLKQGDIITFGAVNAVNPQNRRATGALAMWLVTADVVSGVSGVATIPISGPDGNGIITAGPFQNVDAGPLNAAAITVQGASGTGPTGRGFAFHKDAFALGCADLPLPGGVDMAARVSDKQLGMSLRMVRAYDINTDRFPCRIELLYGWTTLYPQLACRVAS
jgi:coat protein Gp5